MGKRKNPRDKRKRYAGRTSPCHGHTGKPKMKFEHHQEAIAWLIEHNCKEHMKVYRCPFCKMYHLARR